MTNIRVRHFHKNSNLVAAFIPKSGMIIISFYRLGVIVNLMVYHHASRYFLAISGFTQLLGQKNVLWESVETK